MSDMDKARAFLGLEIAIHEDALHADWQALKNMRATIALRIERLTRLRARLDELDAMQGAQRTT
jgi:hypothetical protein